MENIIEIRNRRITINTDMHREDYCKTAILFEVLDGSVTFSYEKHKVTLNKRNLLVINKGTEYQYDASEDTILASLELMGSTFESVCDGVKQSVICNSVNGDNERYDALRAILRQMILNQAYVADNEEEYSYLVFDYYSQYYKLLETIISFFLTDKAGSRRPDGKSGNAERMAQIERYLNVHYADAVSLDRIADELYLSKGYLSRFFTRSFGMTFSEYIKELRLRRAMSDLLYTDKPITQVAFDNGFTSSSFFNRSFREKYRKNPSEVRREFAGDENGRQAAGKVNTDLSERVNRLLDNDGRPIRELDREQLFTCSAADSTPMKQIWNYLINIGRAADLLELGTQEHLSILEETIRSVDAWKNIIGAFVKHIVQKYGIDEVEQWIFELPLVDGYEIEGLDPVEGYIELYTALYDTVRKYTFNLRIGGPSLPTIDTDIMQRMRKVLMERKKMPDYISVISFAYEVDKDEKHYSIRSGDEDYLKKDIARIRQHLLETGHPDLPIFVTEWNETVSDRNFINDTCYRGAYIVKNMIDISEDVEAAGYFSGTDRRSEYLDSHMLLEGANGLLNRNGIMKPAGLALQMMNRLGKNRVAAGSHFLITTDRRNNYYIAAHNKRRLSYYYYKTQEDAIEKEKILKYYEDESYLEQNIELTDILNGDYQIRTLKVNEHKGSVMNIWKELGFSENLSEKDIQYIQKVCEPHLQLEKVTVKDNRIRLKLTMEPNEITLIEVKWVFE